MKSAALAVLFIPGLFGQQTTPAAAKPASITGSVRDAKSGEPISNAIVALTSGVRVMNGAVVQSNNMKFISQATDLQGHYTFSDLVPGECRLSVSPQKQWFPSAQQVLNVSPGQRREER